MSVAFDRGSDAGHPSHGASDRPSHRVRRAIGWREWLVVAAACLVGLLPELALALRSAREPSLRWTGAIGGNVPEDSQQYVAWVIDSSQHGLIGNLFSLAPPERSFLHPAIAVSGLAHGLGLRADLAHAIWVPVALIALLAAAIAFCHRFLTRPGERAAALAVALFYGFPPFLNRYLVTPGTPGSRGLSATSIDSASLMNMWGYPLSVLAFALIPLGLLAQARARFDNRLWSPAAASCLLLAAWLQPWQGLIALVTVLGLEAAMRVRLASPADGRSGIPGLALCATTSVAIAIPVLGYAVLGATDPAFMATGPNTAWIASTERWWTILLAVAPLFAFAAVGSRLPRGATPADLMLRIWPLACVGVALAMALGGIDAQASHALRGIAIPLAVLAVLGWSRVRECARPLVLAFGSVAVVGAAVFLVAGTAERARAQVNSIDSGPPPKGFFIGRDDSQALEWLRHSPSPGGVVAAGGLGALVPTTADRQVWNGHWNWSPHSRQRGRAVRAALTGGPRATSYLLGMNPGRFLAATGARFALLGCGSATGAAISRLAPTPGSTHRFGCSAVIDLGPTTSEDRAVVAERYGP